MNVPQSSFLQKLLFWMVDWNRLAKCSINSMKKKSLDLIVPGRFSYLFFPMPFPHTELYFQS